MKELVKQTMIGMEPAFKYFNKMDKPTYARWLAQQYYIVRHSTPLLALSAGRSIENRAYHLRCISHLSEEKGHDKMLLNDLKALGFNIEQFPELLSTQAYYQTQYYWIEHKNPLSFLGYILFMEALAVKFGPMIHKSATALNPKAALFIGHHSDADEDHLVEAYEVIDNLSALDKQHIADNLALSASLYNNMMFELGNVSKQKASA